MIDYAWIPKLLHDAAFIHWWRPRELSCWLKKYVTYFGEFGYLNSSCIRNSIILRQSKAKLWGKAQWQRCFCCSGPAWRLFVRVPFDQNFQFEFPKFSYVEWNGTFYQAELILFYLFLLELISHQELLQYYLKKCSRIVMKWLKA